MRSLARVALVLAVAAPAVAAPAAGDTARVATTPTCHAAVARGVLPVWARGGFSEPRPRIAHVVGRAQRIAAVLFGDPLRSPHPRHGPSNKILWVSRSGLAGPSDLRIAATRMRGRHVLGRVVYRRVAGGPGPSIIDLPHAGCWRMRLHWSGRSDVLDVRYR